MNSVVIGIDPGPTVCGWCEYDRVQCRVARCVGRMSVEDVIRAVTTAPGMRYAIEDIDARGMPAGHDLIETIRLVGKLEAYAIGPELVRRSVVKRAFCGSQSANDSNVNASVRSWFARHHGLDESSVKGTKKQPGPCYGVSAHAWPALAVAMVAAHGPGLVALSEVRA